MLTLRKPLFLAANVRCHTRLNELKLMTSLYISIGARSKLVCQEAEHLPFPQIRLINHVGMETYPYNVNQ